MSGTASKQATRWVFEGLNHLITVGGTGARAVLHELETLLPGWPPREAVRDLADVSISIDAEPAGFHITERPSGTVSWEPDPFSAAYVLAAGLFENLVSRCPRSLLLHAGAVAIEGQAIAFAAPAMTGKSTLGAACSLAGHPLLGEDRIIARFSNSTLEAIPLGLAQKLRMPVPEPLEPRFRGLLDRRPGRRIADSLFLDWDPETQVAFGEALPLAAIILLTRDGSVPAKSATTPKAKAIREILSLSATPAGPSQHLNIVRDLVERLPILEVGYESCFDAREAIVNTARGWGRHDADI